MTDALAPIAAAERELRLLPLTEADLDLVWDTEKRAYAHPWSRGNFEDSLRHPAQMLLTPPLPGDSPLQLTASGHMLLGYWVAMAGVDEMHLLNIAVAPEHRRQGWGLVLLQALATHTLAQGHAWLWCAPATPPPRAFTAAWALHPWACASSTTRRATASAKTRWS